MSATGEYRSLWDQIKANHFSDTPGKKPINIKPTGVTLRGLKRC